MTIAPADADAQTAGHQVSLAEGDNTVTVTVANGAATRTYTAVITRIGSTTLSSDATLSALSLTGVDIGAFSSTTTDYTAYVANAFTDTDLTAVATDEYAFVTISPADIHSRADVGGKARGGGPPSPTSPPRGRRRADPAGQSDNGSHMRADTTREFWALCSIAAHFGPPGTQTDQAWTANAVRPRQERVAPPRQDHRPQHAASRARQCPHRLRRSTPARLVSCLTLDDEHHGQGERIH